MEPYKYLRIKIHSMSKPTVVGKPNAKFSTVWPKLEKMLRKG